MSHKVGFGMWFPSCRSHTACFNWRLLIGSERQPSLTPPHDTSPPRLWIPHKTKREHKAERLLLKFKRICGLGGNQQLPLAKWRHKLWHTLWDKPEWAVELRGLQALQTELGKRLSLSAFSIPLQTQRQGCETRELLWGLESSHADLNGRITKSCIIFVSFQSLFQNKKKITCISSKSAAIPLGFFTCCFSNHTDTQTPPAPSEPPTDSEDSLPPTERVYFCLPSERIKMLICLIKMYVSIVFITLGSVWFDFFSFSLFLHCH